MGGLRNATQFAASRGIDAVFDAWQGRDQYSGPVQSRFTSFLSQQDTRPFQFQPPVQQQYQQPPIFMDGNVPGPPIQPGGSTTTTTTGNIAPAHVGEEGTIVTGRDGVRYDLDKPKRLIDKNKKYNAELLRVAGDNPEIHSTCEVVNRLDELAEFFVENFDPEVARMLTQLSRFTVRAEQAIVRGVSRKIQNFNPVTSIANSFVGVAKLGTFLIGEIAKVEALERGVLAGDVDQAAGQLHQYFMAQREAASQLMQHLKNITWEEAFEHGSEIATEMLLLYGTTKFVGIASQKFLSEFTKLTEAIKAEKAVSASAGKTTTIFEGINADIALSSKLAVEYNPEVAQNVLGALVKDAEFIASDNLGTTFREKTVNFFKRFKEKRSIRQTGARSTRPSCDYEAWEVWAPKKYDEIRECTTDIQQIAKNTGMPEHQIARIKQHVFFDDTHILDHGVGRFAPDPAIAQAWERLGSGTFIDNDIKLLRHEIFECKYEKVFNKTAREAHQGTISEKINRKWQPPQGE